MNSKRMPLAPQSTEKFDRLKAILREMFQLDRGDLDFGLYRIMNLKAKEIEGFLDNDLLPQVRTALAGNTADTLAELEENLAEARGQAMGLGVDPETTPKVEELKQQLAEAKADVAAETDVYNHLANFFARFLQFCCDGEGLHLHLNVSQGSGGDSVSVVREAARRLTRHLTRKDVSHSLVLLYRDRHPQDLQAGRDAQAVASRSKLEIIFQSPNLEGLLLRPHRGHENREIAAGDAITELRNGWPEYGKSSLTADQLKRRFTVSDLRRAARHDEWLRKLLDVLGL